MATQVYLDYCRNLASPDTLMAEQRVDLSHVLGVEGGGTADCIIVKPRHLHVIDLKYGQGVRVSAEQNPQLRLYGLGALELMDMFGPFDAITYHIVQPRLDAISTWTEPVADAVAFGVEARAAVEQAVATIAAVKAAGMEIAYLNPGTKQCRWCRAKTECPALAASVAAAVGAEFETMAATELSPISANNADLVTRYSALSLIEDWCRAVRSEVQTRVMRGDQLIGPDKLPMKMVQGAEGKRQWLNEKAAEAALIGQLPIDKAYAPAKIITAPVAAKLLDKKATKALWADIFVPLIGKARGAPAVAWGSDERPAYVAAATAEEFNIPGEADATAE